MAATGPGSHAPRARARDGFTLIELLVVISIIMVLAAMALPVLMRAARQARGANCVANLKQLAVAFRSYSTNHMGILPGTEGPGKPYPRPTWLYPEHPWTKGDLSELWPEMPTKGELFPWYRDPRLIHCPSDRDGNGKLSYSVPQNCAHRLQDDVENSTKAILIMEEHPMYNIGGLPPNDGARREGGFGCSDRPARRHSGKAGTAHFDGSAGIVEYPEGFSARDLETEPWGFACGWQ